MDEGRYSRDGERRLPACNLRPLAANFCTDSPTARGDISARPQNQGAAVYKPPFTQSAIFKSPLLRASSLFAPRRQARVRILGSSATSGAWLVLVDREPVFLAHGIKGK